MHLKCRRNRNNRSGALDSKWTLDWMEMNVSHSPGIHLFLLHSILSGNCYTMNENGIYFCNYLIGFFETNQPCKFFSSIKKCQQFVAKHILHHQYIPISNFQFMLTDIYYCSISKLSTLYTIGATLLIQNCQFLCSLQDMQLTMWITKEN
jgi:hypothetical protein